MYAPICLLTYNRPEHFRRTIENLRANHLARDSELFVCSNAPITDDDKTKVSNIREYASKINGFKKIYLIENNINKGSSEHCFKRVSEILKEYRKIIQINDDELTTKNFLNFMNEGLDYYENNKSIFSIGGYTLPIAFNDCGDADVYFLPRTCSWGFATWHDRWSSIKWNITKDDLKKTDWFKFNETGFDCYNMLKGYIQHPEDCLDVAWHYSIYVNNMVTVYPKEGFVNDIGLDGSGLHFSINDQDKYPMCLINNENKIKFIFTDNIIINRKIVTRFKKYFGNFFYFYIIDNLPLLHLLLRRIKRTLFRLIGK
jgi:hypothetical protein